MTVHVFPFQGGVAPAFELGAASGMQVIPFVGKRHIVNAVNFDGTNDYLTRGADLTGIADGKEGTVSVWINMQGGDDTGQFPISTGTGSAPNFSLRRESTNTVRVRGENSSGSLVLSSANVTTITASDGWSHVLISWDLAAETVLSYINDIDQGVGTAVNDDLDYTQGGWAIGANTDGTTKIDADLAEVWFDTTFIDISVASNRRKFINSNLKPVDLGSDGSNPTGSPPLVYLTGATSSWHTNKGTGGGFTENGALTDAATSPSD